MRNNTYVDRYNIDVTVLRNFLVQTLLFFRASGLSGAWNGVGLLLEPKWHMLLVPEVIMRVVKISNSNFLYFKLKNSEHLKSYFINLDLVESGGASDLRLWLWIRHPHYIWQS